MGSVSHRGIWEFIEDQQEAFVAVADALCNEGQRVLPRCEWRGAAGQIEKREYRRGKIAKIVRCRLLACGEVQRMLVMREFVEQCGFPDPRRPSMTIIWKLSVSRMRLRACSSRVRPMNMVIAPSCVTMLLLICNTGLSAGRLTADSKPSWCEPILTKLGMRVLMALGPARQSAIV